MWRVFLIVVLVLLSSLAALWLLQRRLIYLPSSSMPEAGDVPEFVEEARFTTEDGLTLAAWYIPSRGEASGSVLVFSGNAGNRSHRLPLADALSAAGYSTLLVDYRGYGGNPGSPTEQGLAADARAALDYLQSRADVDADQISYFGESLGSGVAVRLATERAPAGLVLRSPFPSLQEVAAVHYPILPASLLLWDRYPNADLIGDVASPVLFIVGADDRIVPRELSERLYVVTNEPKRLVVIEGAGHNDPQLLSGLDMITEVVEFLRGTAD